MKQPHTFAERLRFRREELSLTQVVLAKRAGMHQSGVAHLESGTRRPTAETLEKLAVALDVGMDWLSGRKR